MKLCTSCNIEKETSEFYKAKNTKSGFRPACKKCEALRLAKFYQEKVKTNPDKLAVYNARSKKFRANNPEATRRIRLKFTYGISTEFYDKLYQQQKGNCLICNTFKKVLNIDHDHKTGQIRGLLCQSCNAGIGHFKDNPELLYKASRYMEEVIKNGYYKQED